MNDLKNFISLQARWYEFLEQQDEATVRAIANGSVQLGIVGANAAPGSPSPERPLKPSSEPWQVAQDLSKLPSEDERRIYLNSAQLLVKDLRGVARSMGLRGYGNLAKTKLIALLASHSPDRASATVNERSVPAAAPPVPKDSPSEPVSSPAGTGAPQIDVTTVAAHLRELETEEEGAVYLHEQHLDRDALLAVAAELQLTRVTRLSQPELEKRVLKQAIGARRKFAGLRKW
ncbi:hypothetical protein GCM10027258_05730 [Amycolatopsis stemonae]